MKKHILQAYKILSRIESDKAYSNLALYGEDVSYMATLLVYGVLENSIRINYILSQLVPKKPQNAIAIFLKIGVYALENLSDVPAFAIVSECVESAKSVGKSGAAGFINAVLKKVAGGEYKLPSEGDAEYLQVKYSKPKWFIDKLRFEYGYDTMLKIISAKTNRLEHLRVNSRLANLQDTYESIKSSGEACELSEVGGIIARGSDFVKGLFNRGLVTYQAASSMLAVKALAIEDGNSILDLCSAPGGKAVYASELSKNGEVTACELYPHRLKLIEKYKKRMRAENVTPVLQDATAYNPSFNERFDRVLLDAPCSCFGTFLKHPDVFLSRGEQDIKALSVTQSRILENAAKYVKKGGILVYSTCTLFKVENADVVGGLIKSGGFEPIHIKAIENIDNGSYKDNQGSVQILPHGEYDGFYIAALRKI